MMFILYVIYHNKKLKNCSIFMKTTALEVTFLKGQDFQVCIQKVGRVAAFSLMLINYKLESPYILSFISDSFMPPLNQTTWDTFVSVCLHL